MCDLPFMNTWYYFIFITCVIIPINFSFIFYTATPGWICLGILLILMQVPFYFGFLNKWKRDEIEPIFGD